MNPFAGEPRSGGLPIGPVIAAPVLVGGLIVLVDGEPGWQCHAGARCVGAQVMEHDGDRDEGAAVDGLAGQGCGDLVLFAGEHAIALGVLAVFERQPFRYFVTSGGLASYGVDRRDQYRRAADYIARILKGDKPADLPAQTPTKFELVVNLNAAKLLGVSIPNSLLATADDVIE